MQNGNPVVRFEIGCENSSETQAFYRTVFGWKINEAQHTHHVDTQSKKGIPGAITSLGHEPHQYMMVYIEVPSVKETITSIESNGGKCHIGPLPTGAGQYFAWIYDPEGNMLGILSDQQ